MMLTRAFELALDLKICDIFKVCCRGEKRPRSYYASWLSFFPSLPCVVVLPGSNALFGSLPRLSKSLEVSSLQWSFMRQTVRPAGRLSGMVVLPGDKSISHRYAMLASLAEGHSKITNYATGADCHSTLGCVRALGIDVEENGT